MVLSWFDAKEAKRFGTELAHFFMERLPLETGDKKSKSMTRKQEVLDKMFQQAGRFKLEHKLNIYRKAQLGNVFKWELKDAGYDPEFVDELTKALMLRL
jgi:hypothetical protein